MVIVWRSTTVHIFMPASPVKIEPPRRIFWVLGWLSLAFGLVFLMCGYYLAHEDIARTFGMILATLGGIGFGVGGRILASCYVGLKKSRR